MLGEQVLRLELPSAIRLDKTVLKNLVKIAVKNGVTKEQKWCFAFMDTRLLMTSLR